MFVCYYATMFHSPAATAGRDAALGSSMKAQRLHVPPRLRRHSQLPCVDYQDAFAIESALVPTRAPAEWAKVLVDETSPSGGQALWAAFSALGVLPQWEPQLGSSGVAVLSGNSGIGLSAELLFECREQTLIFATLVRFARPVARVAWAGLSLAHRRVVPLLMERAVTPNEGQVDEQLVA